MLTETCIPAQSSISFNTDMCMSLSCVFGQQSLRMSHDSSQLRIGAPELLCFACLRLNESRWFQAGLKLRFSTVKCWLRRDYLPSFSLNAQRLEQLTDAIRSSVPLLVPLAALRYLWDAFLQSFLQSLPLHPIRVATRIINQLSHHERLISCQPSVSP